jgi:primosomal protein N'
MKSLKIKPLSDILDETPLFNKNIQFYAWLADYYLCSLGDIQACCSLRLEIESKRKILPISVSAQNLCEKTKLRKEKY